MKKYLLSCLIFLVISLLTLFFFEFDFAIIAIVLMNVSFYVSYAIVLQSQKHSLAKRIVLYPITIGFLSLFFLVFERVFYIPVITTISKIIGKMFPVGHFGYSAFFIFAAVNVMLTVLIVYILQRINSKTSYCSGNEWKPNRLIAVILSWFISPVGMLYLGRKGLAILYLLLIVGVVVFRMTILSVYSERHVWWLYSLIPLIAAVHAGWLALRINEPRKWYSRWYALIAVTLVFVTPVLVLRVFFYETFRIPAISMAPTIQLGDVVVVKKFGCGNYRLFDISVYQSSASESCQVNRGDVIVFQYPPKPYESYIKRVVAMGGDTVKIKDEDLYVNGKMVEVDYIDSNEQYTYYQETLDGKTYQIMQMNQHTTHRYKFTEMTVPDGSYFVLGDNRDYSSDSRIWGVVPEENLIGKIVFIYR